MATLVRWEPLRELATLQAEVSRFMNGLSEGNGRTTQSWVPPVDVWETESELVYSFDLPGVAQDKLTVDLHDDTLTVAGERERTQELSEDGFYRFERRYGRFTRALAVPQGTPDNSVKADYKDGVLEIRIAKPPAKKPRRIEIGGEQSSHPTIEGETPAA